MFFHVCLLLLLAGRADCNSCCYRPINHDSTLNGWKLDCYQLAAFGSTSIAVCGHKCYATFECRSFNFNLVTGECYLNSATRSQDTSSCLKKTDDYSYYETFIPEENNSGVDNSRMISSNLIELNVTQVTDDVTQGETAVLGSIIQQEEPAVVMEETEVVEEA